MKEIVKDITEVRHVTIYTAIDGTEFNSERACVAYEQGAGCAAKKRLMDCVVRDNFTEWDLFHCGNEETSAFVVCPRNSEDINAINTYVAVVNHETANKTAVKKLVGDDQIGKNVVVFYNEDSEWSWIMTEEQILERLNEYLHPKVEETKVEETK